MEEKIKSILSAYPNKLILSNLTDKSYKYKKTTIVRELRAKRTWCYYGLDQTSD